MLVITFDNDDESCCGSTTTPVAAEGPRVAVLGCGPGGMFFVHAVALNYRHLLPESIKGQEEQKRLSPNENRLVVPKMQLERKNTRRPKGKGNPAEVKRNMRPKARGRRN